MQASVENIAAAIVTQAGLQSPADAVLRAELKRHRQLSPESTRKVTRMVFAYYRWLHWLGPGPVKQQVAKAIKFQERFHHQPASFTDAELAEKAVPAWTWQEVTLSPAWLHALQSEPKLWLRARPGRGKELTRKLGESRGPNLPRQSVDPSARRETTQTGLLDALEYFGERDLFRTAEFHAGAFEIQDLSSQLVGLLCNPAPGETWWDACAGEGGKTLHLSDLMQNKGLIWASDRSPRRLQHLKRRAARAGIFNYRSALWDGGAKLPTKTKFDGVLLDAPCSGLGTWQRNPHARWTVTLKDVHELSEIQSQLLRHAAVAVKPGGKLVYAVCTMTRAETIEVMNSFEARFTEFQRIEQLNPLASTHSSSAPLWIWPQDSGGNGMFVAAWRRLRHKSGDQMQSPCARELKKGRVENHSNCGHLLHHPLSPS